VGFDEGNSVNIVVGLKDVLKVGRNEGSMVGDNVGL